MKTSQAGVDFIKFREGVRLNAYKDSAGRMTIGYGHLILPGEHLESGIQESRAERLLILDLAVAEDAINRMVHAPLTQNQFDALVSLVFNIGTGAFHKSTLRSLLNIGNMTIAADEFLRWNKADGKVFEGLINRRRAERELFLKEL